MVSFFEVEVLIVALIILVLEAQVLLFVQVNSLV